MARGGVPRGALVRPQGDVAHAHGAQALTHVLAATQPWWPHLFSFPRFLDPISWWWLSVKGYALTSSWFQPVWIVTALILIRHHNCNHHRCLSFRTYPHGHLRLCKTHHPGVQGKIGQDAIDDVSHTLGRPDLIEPGRRHAASIRHHNRKQRSVTK